MVSPGREPLLAASRAVFSPLLCPLLWRRGTSSRVPQGAEPKPTGQPTGGRALSEEVRLDTQRMEKEPPALHVYANTVGAHLYVFLLFGEGKQVLTQDPEINGGTLKPDSLLLMTLLLAPGCKPSRPQHRASHHLQEPSLHTRLEVAISTNSHMLLSGGCRNKIAARRCHPCKIHSHLQNGALLPSIPSAALSLDTLFTPRYARYPKHRRSHHRGP